jgi:hypothetical protein
MGDEPRERPFILQWRSAVLNARLTGTQKLCLLVLAEWADADGTNCWPAMESIAEKASVNEKTVRRSMDELDPLGWFTRSHRRTQKGWKQFEYVLRIPDAADTVSCRSEDAPDSVSATSTDAPGTVSGSDATSTGHPVHLHRTLTSDAPGTVSDDLALPIQDLSKKEVPVPVEKVTKGKSRKLTFSQWMETLEADPVLEAKVDQVQRYAKRIGLPEDFEDLAWEVFSDRYRNDPGYVSKRYLDWAQVYRNAISGNWLKLWWIDQSGVYQLTTVGKQAAIQFGIGIERNSDPIQRPKLVA